MMEMSFYLFLLLIFLVIQLFVTIWNLNMTCKQT